jgi:hypothetical protein
MEFQALSEQMISGDRQADTTSDATTSTASVCDVGGWLELPFISPCQEAVALPVSLPSILAVFSEVLALR